MARKESIFKPRPGYDQMVANGCWQAFVPAEMNGNGMFPQPCPNRTGYEQDLLDGRSWVAQCSGNNVDFNAKPTREPRPFVLQSTRK